MSDTLNYNPALPESRQFAPRLRAVTVRSISRVITRTLSGRPAAASRKAGK